MLIDVVTGRLALIVVGTDKARLYINLSFLVRLIPFAFTVFEPELSSASRECVLERDPGHGAGNAVSCCRVDAPFSSMSGDILLDVHCVNSS